MRETRMKSGEMNFNRPKSLVSFVTDNGSGSFVQTSYDPLRKVWGQNSRARASRKPEENQPENKPLGSSHNHCLVMIPPYGLGGFAGPPATPQLSISMWT